MDELDEPKEPKLLLLPLDEDELLELDELEREELDLASARIGLNARAKVTRATCGVTMPSLSWVGAMTAPREKVPWAYGLLIWLAVSTVTRYWAAERPVKL